MAVVVRRAVQICTEWVARYFDEAVAFCVLAVPLAVFSVWFLLCLCSKTIRRSEKIFFVYLSETAICLFVAGSVCRRFSAQSILAVAFSSYALYLILYALLRLFRGKVNGEKAGKLSKKSSMPAQKSPMPVQNTADAASKTIPPDCTRPQLIRCYNNVPADVSVGEDVRLEHIFSVLERLNSLPLGAGDRLETANYERLLTAYRAKGKLNAEEVRALNDILASLLKMMAKYDL